MLHRAWNSKGEMPYCIPRSSIKFQGHTALKIVQFDPNWAFPDCNFSLNSPMAMKCCTELETTKERCPIVFQGHPSNFKVTRDKTSLILSQIGHFRTIGRSQLSNPSDLPCCLQVQNHNGFLEKIGFFHLNLKKLEETSKMFGNDWISHQYYWYSCTYCHHCHHWFRQWLGTSLISHYQNQWWLEFVVAI